MIALKIGASEPRYLVDLNFRIELWPNLGQLRSDSPTIGPIRADPERNLAELGPNAARIWPMSPRFGQTLARLGPPLTELAKHWPHRGQLWPTSGRARPNLANIWPDLTNISNIWPSLGQIGSEVATKSVKVGQTLTPPQKHCNRSKDMYTDAQVLVGEVEPHAATIRGVRLRGVRHRGQQGRREDRQGGGLPVRAGVLACARCVSPERMQIGKDSGVSSTRSGGGYT